MLQEQPPPTAVTSELKSEVPTPVVKKYKRISEEFKNLIVKLHHRDRRPVAEISQLLDIKRTTIHEFLKRYEKNPSIANKKSVGRRPMLAESQRLKMREWIAESGKLTLQALAKKCEAEFGFKVSRQTVQRALKNLPPLPTLVKPSPVKPVQAPPPPPPPPPPLVPLSTSPSNNNSL